LQIYNEENNPIIGFSEITRSQEVYPMFGRIPRGSPRLDELRKIKKDTSQLIAGSFIIFRYNWQGFLLSFYLFHRGLIKSRCARFLSQAVLRSLRVGGSICIWLYLRRFESCPSRTAEKAPVRRFFLACQCSNPVLMSTRIIKT
jgi:hypothetical protein